METPYALSASVTGWKNVVPPVRQSPRRSSSLIHSSPLSAAKAPGRVVRRGLLAGLALAACTAALSAAPGFWQASVTKMKTVYGAPVPDEDAAKIVAYLNAAYRKP